MVHNQELHSVDSDRVERDKLWSFVKKKQKHVLPEAIDVGDCSIEVTIAEESGLILSARVGKHTDQFLEELVCSTEGKTDCYPWDSDGWSVYEQVLPDCITLWVGKAGTQKLERTNGILRGQVGRWHRWQYKFGKVWEPSEVSLPLVVSYFNGFG